MSRKTEIHFLDVIPRARRGSSYVEPLGPDDVIVRGEAMAGGALELAAGLGELGRALAAAGWRVNLATEDADGGAALTLSVRREA
ncbi:MAG: DUF3459 domain-containing protein [Pseudomonadota bacterium]